MQAFPHVYRARADAGPTGEIRLGAERLPTLRSLPPAEFDGPGDYWSPETLFVAAVADCYVLTFRAITGVARTPWTALTCRIEGTVDRVNRATQFTDLVLRARLEIPAGSDAEQARRLLTQAKHACLVTNSLKPPVRLEADVVVHAADTSFGMRSV
jgi:organic hydroperoxide reductase OsmC/OhrA